MALASPQSSLVKSITLTNLLSFNDSGELQLRNLNVLIGPNGAGKSNLLEAIDLLRGTGRDIRTLLTRGGGVSEWVWKGASTGVAEVNAVLSNAANPADNLRHTFAFVTENQSFRLYDERIENAKPNGQEMDVYFYYRFLNGHPVINTVGKAGRHLRRETFDLNQSILTQVRDPEIYPEISYLSGVYPQIRLYREWAFGRQSVFRQPQKADLPHDRLEEDFSNLGLFLNHLATKPSVKRELLSRLADLYEEVTDFGVHIVGGTVQVFFTEGDFTIPATRLSDGTLRYLCLLAILCDPAPPPFIGIEEPELGLHPDILPKLADLLVEASSRTQLLVTTHSDILIDALTAQPESVMVCEKRQGATTINRLEIPDLTEWLQKYRLGELWTRGQLGGTRW